MCLCLYYQMIYILYILRTCFHLFIVRTRKTMPHFFARHTCVCIYPHICTGQRVCAHTHTTTSSHAHARASKHTHTHTHTPCVYCTRTVTHELAHARTCTNNLERTHKYVQTISNVDTRRLRTHMHTNARKCTCTHMHGYRRVHASHTFYREPIL